MTALPKQLRPRKDPRQQRAHETRQRVLDAAARIFARYGYAAGTTNRIAEEAQLSVGSLYQYFPNKDAILVELVRAHVAEGVAAVGTALREISAAQGDVAEELATIVRIVVGLHARDPLLHRVLFEESPRPRALLDELHALERATVEAVAHILEAHPGVRVGDARLAAWIVLTTIESLTHRFVSGHPDTLEAVDAEAFEQEVVTLLTRYLTGSSPEHAPRP